MNKKFIYGLVAVVMVGAVAVVSLFALVLPNAQDKSANTQSSQEATATPTQAAVEAAPRDVSYQGVEGKTALALLQDKAEVEMTGTGEMAYVTTINGYKAKDNEFWAFYVNGEQAQVGAGTYVTSGNDEIVWKIESFTN